MPTSPRRGSAADGVADSAVVGVTLGAEGFLWRDGAQERRVAAPPITAVDTLAAGDVWHGAFTLRLGESGA